MKIKFVQLNGLVYNRNRDPQVYRRTPGKPFRLRVALEGQGSATAYLLIDGERHCEKTVALPGYYVCEIAFDTPGARTAELVVEQGGERLTEFLLLDVEEHAWVG